MSDFRLIVGWYRDTFLNDCRCYGDLAKHFKESVLLKLPENYQSDHKQSLISEVDDMGTYLKPNRFEP